MIGLNEEAWEIWVAYRKAIKKALKPVSIELAKQRLASFGDFETQMEAVLTSKALGYTGVFKPKKTKAQLDAEKAKVREQIEMRELEARAVKIGYRSPMPNEDLCGYRALVERAERAQPNKRQGMQTIAKILERVQ